jgi:hypothetical protein
MRTFVPAPATITRSRPVENIDPLAHAALAAQDGDRRAGSGTDEGLPAPRSNTRSRGFP